jgi:hypothetical protein
VRRCYCACSRTTVDDTFQESSAPATAHQAARYADEASSAASYDQTQRALYASPCDLATYRLVLMPDNLWHVVVLGDVVSDDLHQRLTDSLATGERVSVPNDLLIALNQHRKAQPTINGWAERHALPRPESLA